MPPLGYFFWFLMLVWLVFGYVNRPASQPYYWGGWILNFILFAMLGWVVFGGTK